MVDTKWNKLFDGVTVTLSECVCCHQCVTHRHRQQQRPAIRLTASSSLSLHFVFATRTHITSRHTCIYSLNFNIKFFLSFLLWVVRFVIYERTNANSHAHIEINCTISIHQIIFKHDTSDGSRFHSFAHFCWVFVLFINFNLLFIFIIPYHRFASLSQSNLFVDANRSRSCVLRLLSGETFN